MRIAVNICSAEPVSGIPIYYRLLLNQLVTSSADHHFMIYTNDGFHFAGTNPQNAEIISIPAVKTSFPLKKLAWVRKLSRQILSGKPDLLINCHPFGNILLPVPQVLMLDETAVELFADGLQWRPRRALLRNLQLAKTTLLPSQYDEERLMGALRNRPSNTSIIGIGPQLHAIELDWETREKVKETHTGGREYFLVTPVRLKADAVINLLKAFSLFKKRQQSNLQLLLPEKLVEQHPDLEKKLANYKYREDVSILPRLPDSEQLELIAAAYGIIDPSDHLFSNALTMQAFESGTPVILSTKGRAVEMAGKDSVLEAALDQPQELANQMMLLYKDEHLRKRLVMAGKSSLEKNNWQLVVQKLRDCLEAVIQDS